jgi:hypothetical protein
MMKKRLFILICLTLILACTNIVNADTFTKKTSSPDIKIEYMLSWYKYDSGHIFVFLCLENVGNAELSYYKFNIRFWMDGIEAINAYTLEDYDWDPGERRTVYGWVDRGTAKCDELTARIDEDDIPEDTNKQNDEETCEITYESKITINAHKSGIETPIENVRIECKIKKENDQNYENLYTQYTDSKGKFSISVPPNHEFSIKGEHDKYKFETQYVGPLSPGQIKPVDLEGSKKSKEIRPVFLNLLEQILLRLRSL